MKEMLKSTTPIEQPRNAKEDSLGAALPGDTHINPNPYAGRGLSKNPPSTGFKWDDLPKPPPTIYGTYKLPNTSMPDTPRHKEKRSESLRKLVSPEKNSEK
jgi:hypothetical protein